MTYKGELGHVLEGGGGNFKPVPTGSTTIVGCEGEPSKSGYLTSDPGWLSTINWRTLC